MRRVRSSKSEMSDRDAVHHKRRRRRHNPWLRRRLRLNSNVATATVRNNAKRVASSNRGRSRDNNNRTCNDLTCHVKRSVQQVHHRLNVRHDLCDNSNRRLNALQHLRDRNPRVRNRNNNDG